MSESSLVGEVVDDVGPEFPPLLRRSPQLAAKRVGKNAVRKAFAIVVVVQVPVFRRLELDSLAVLQRFLLGKDQEAGRQEALPQGPASTIQRVVGPITHELGPRLEEFGGGRSGRLSVFIKLEHVFGIGDDY